MSCIQGFYEPILNLEESDQETIRKLYLKILQSEFIHCMVPIKMDIKDLIVLDNWDVEPSTFLNLQKLYCHTPTIKMPQ